MAALKISNEIGMATFVGALTFLTMIGGGFYVAGQIKSGGEQSTKAIEKIEQSDQRQSEQISALDKQLAVIKEQTAVMKDVLIEIKGDLRDIKQRQLGEIYRKPQ